MSNKTLKVVIVLAIVCYSLVTYSFNKRSGAIFKEKQEKDTIHVIAESDSLFVKGKYHYFKKEYTTAIACFLKSDSVINAHYGTDSPYYGYGERWASCCYHQLGMDSIAMKYSVYYNMQPIDKMLTHSSDSVIWIALKLEESGQVYDALEKLLEAAKLEEQELGSNNYWHVNTLSYCAGLYSEIGQFEKAIELGTYAVEFYKSNYGIEHPNYATCLSNLSTFYSDSGNEFVAIQLGKEALEIQKKLRGSEYYGYADELSNLAESYSAIGNYSEALHLGEEAMNIRKRNVGTEHSDYAMSLICLASYYSAIGNNSKALLLGTEAMDIWKKVLGTDHPYYATSLSRLSGYYSDLGYYTKAVQLETEAMEIRKRVLGIEDPHYTTSLGNLAIYNSYLSNYTEAIRIGKENMELSKKIFGTEHPNYAASLAILASLYLSVENYTEAQLLSNKALEIWKKAFGTDHPGYANILNSLAKCNAGLGNYTKALLLGKQSNEIVKRVFGTGHPYYALSLCNLASFYANTGNYAEAYSYLKQYITSSQSYLLNSFVELAPNLRESLWTRKFASYYNSLLPCIVEKHKTNESISELYNKTCLFAKGILLNTDMEISNLILESGDSALIAKYNNLSSNISIYNKLIETPINKRFINADSLSNVIQQQGMELAKDSKAYGDYTHNLTINWKDVQKKLSKDDIAIEFLDFPVDNSDSTLYVALTLRNDYDCPHMVTLFENNQLKAIPESVYFTQSDVFDLIWKPLEEELSGVRNIYFAPSGKLHQIGIEYLPISKTENISDVYTLHRLSSTRQLAIIQDETKGNSTILYGGINYDDKSSTISTTPASIKRDVSRFAFVYRGNIDSLSLRNSYDYLEGTKREADMIADNMKQHRVPYIYFSGINGSEESFKNLNGTKPKAIHIATHGFYFTEDEAKESYFARPRMELITEEFQKIVRFVEDKPMTRSGLLFSGCNRAFRHEQIPESEEDGILTAQEISALDLRGLDLVVLSACQTGLGDVISGEGIFGLQRGFKKAGAKTILMSLNKVDDEATGILMVEFYKNLMSGKTKYQSLYSAQQYLRKVENGKYDDPKYWASFVMLDGIN